MPRLRENDKPAVPHTRILVQMGSGGPTLVIMQAALDLAKALASEIEGLYVEDEQVISAASFTFTREISPTGGKSRTIASDSLAREMHASAHAMQRRFRQLAEKLDIVLHYQVVRDEIGHALYEASAKARFIALSQPMARAMGHSLFGLINDLKARQPHIEGFLLIGAHAHARKGPVMLVVDEGTPVSDLAHRLQLCARLAVNGRQKLILLTQSDTPGTALASMIDQLLHQNVTVEPRHAPGTSEEDLTHMASRQRAGLLVLGRDSAPALQAHPLGRLTCMLDTPLLLLD